MYIIFRISPGGSRNRKGKGGMSLIWTPAGHGFHSVVVFMVDELSEPWLFQVPVRDKQSEPLTSKSRGRERVPKKSTISTGGFWVIPSFPEKSYTVVTEIVA